MGEREKNTDREKGRSHKTRTQSTTIFAMHSHFKCTMKTKEKKNNITAPAKLHNIDGYVFLTKKIPPKETSTTPNLCHCDKIVSWIKCHQGR